jgi:hypothetical protein
MNMNAPDKMDKNRLDANARAGEIFVKDYYYRVYDTSRHEVHRFYRDDSTVIWNGNAKKGVQSLNDFFKQLPPTRHTILSIDCHPMPGTDPSRANVLVSVAGTVEYAQQDPRQFSHSFVLVQEAKGTYYILNDCFRLTSGPISRQDNL